MPSVAAPLDLSLRLDKPDEFVTVRAFLRRAEFDDAIVCRVLGIRDMSELGNVRWEALQPTALSSELNWCIQVFLRGLPMNTQQSRVVCGDDVFDALLLLGLLRPSRMDTSAVVCPVWLYPVDGFLMASDRRDDPEGQDFVPSDDVVFPAIYPGTLRFLQLLPAANDGETLDLCGGSGIGALHVSRTARLSVTADITARSAFYAEFNARLNGATVESVCGDLYEPVSGRQFDLVSAHPPFVPSTGRTMVYRDAGESGEEVTRRVVEGLAGHLRVGGTCVILCVARDTVDGPLEQRVCGWLGPKANEFDVVFGLEKVLSVEEVVDSMRRRGQQIDDESARALLERLRSLGTKQFVYGALFVKRLPGPGPQKPSRVHLSYDGTAKDFERLLTWRDKSRSPRFSDWLADSRPRLAPNLELKVRHLVVDGELVPCEFVFSIEGGFRAGLRLDGWVVPLLARLAGTKSVQELFAAARSADELPEGFTLAAFVKLVGDMIERGFLEVQFSPEPAVVQSADQQAHAG